MQAAFLEFNPDLARYVLGAAHFRRHRAAQHRNAGPRAAFA